MLWDPTPNPRHINTLFVVVVDITEQQKDLFTRKEILWPNSTENRYALEKRERGDYDPAQFDKPLLRVSIKGGVLEDNRPLYGMDAGKEKDLTSTQRDQIRRMHFIEGMDAKAIAERLGLDPGNVGKAIGGMKRWGKPASHVLDAEVITPKGDLPGSDPMPDPDPEPEKVFMNLDQTTETQTIPEPPFSLKIEGAIIRPGEAEAFVGKLLEAVKGPIKPAAPETTDVIGELINYWDAKADSNERAATRAKETAAVLRTVDCSDTYSDEEANEIARAITDIVKRGKSA